MNDSNDSVINDIAEYVLDIEVMGPVEKMLEVAKEKALAEATDSWTDGNGQGHHKSPTDGEKERIDEEVAALRKRFEEVLEPRPVDFDVLIDTMTKVENALGVYAATENLDANSDRIGGNADFGLVDTAKADIDKDWDGRFKNELVENYLTPLSPGIIATQGNLARYLRQHAELMKLVYERRRSDAKMIAKEAVTAFEGVNDSGGIELKIILAAIGGLIGFGAAVAGPLAAPAHGIAIGLSTAAFGAANAIGGNFLPAPGAESPLGADTVEGVADNIYKALDENDKQMREEEDEILESLQNVAGVVDRSLGAESVEKGSELIPLRPQIADALTPEDLRDGLTSYPDDNGDGSDGDDGADGDDGDDGDGGSGSWFGPGAPEDWDGSVHNPPPVGIRMV